MVMVIGLVMTSRLLGNMDDLHGASGHHEGDGDLGDSEDKGDGDRGDDVSNGDDDGIDGASDDGRNCDIKDGCSNGFAGELTISGTSPWSRINAP